ncbi:MAG: hypothetical protein JWM58_4550 [Rhizobium sp.]|nr:hypothetical protein [Rhizobium sp.]
MTQFNFIGGMFGEGAGTALEYNFLDLDFHEQDTKTSSINFGIADVASVFGSISATYDLAFNLLGTARLDLGSLQSSFEFDANAVVSPAKAIPNAAAFIDTSAFTYTDLQDKGIDAAGPSAADSYVKMELGASLTANVQANVGYSYDILIASGSGSQNILNADVNLGIPTTEIFKITAENLGGVGGYTLDLGYGSVTAALPEFNYEDAELINDGSQFGSLHMTGKSSPFLTAEVDLDSFLPIPLSFGQGLDMGPVSFNVEAGVLDARLVGTASLAQDITYTPDIDVTMETSLGQTVEGDLGDKFKFDTPEGEGTFTVDATYAMSVTLKAITSLVLEASFDWKIGYGDFEAELDIIGYKQSWSEGFTLLQDSHPFGEGISIEIMNDVSVYEVGESVKTFTVSYENFVTAASGKNLQLTSHQKNVDGGAVGNNITGNDLSNILNGQGGWDVIKGGIGRDMLNGGKGNDVLIGGKGADSFIFDATVDHSSDLIKDMNFKQGDVLDLSGIDANTLANKNQAFKFIGSDEFSGRAGQLRFEDNHGDTILTGDWDGDEKADFTIVIDGGSKFVETQMML